MGLVEDLESPMGSGCGYAAALDSLPPYEAAAIETAVADSAFGVMKLSRLLAKNEVPITQQQISRHRRQECVECR